MLKKSSCMLDVPQIFYQWYIRGEITNWWTNYANRPVRVARYQWRTQSLARILYQKYHNVRLEDGKRVSSICKNRLCLNINHLYIGQKDDLPRLKQPRKQKPFLKLSLEKHKEIRSMYSSGNFSLRKIAAKYGVCLSLIQKVIKSTPAKISFSDLLSQDV